MSKSSFWSVKLICLAIAFFCAGRHGARAVLMRPMSIEELTTNAQVVLHAKVLSKTVQRDSSGQIFTSIELTVIEPIKGRPEPNRFTIVQHGGVLGDEVTTVSGQADYEVGEEVVSFLVLNPQGQGVTLGLAQGKFHVQQDKTTRQLVVHNPFHGQRAKEGQPLKLTDLKQQVKGVRP